MIKLPAPVDVSTVLLDGPRVFVRRLMTDDVPELSRLLQESADFHRPWVSYPHATPSLDNYLLDANAEGTILFLVILRSSGKLIGLINLSRFALGAWRTCECGCAVGVRHRGRGYLREALGLLVRYAMSDLGMRRIEALVDPENVPSQRMLEAVGFRSEGVARAAIGDDSQRFDQVRWAITAGDLTGDADTERR